MPFTQLRYANGDGGGDGGSANIGPATVISTDLVGPWNWLAWSQYPGQQHLVTDLDILSMAPPDVVQLYYDLLQFRAIPQTTVGKCFEIVPNPIVSAGLTAAEAEEFEGRLRDRIYTLRGDIHTVTLNSGETVPGLVDLRGVKTSPPCTQTTLGTVLKWVTVAASSVLTAGVGTIISVAQLARSLAQSALELGSQLQAMHAQLNLVDKIVSGAYSIVGRQFRDKLTGLQLRPYAEAVSIPTSSLAWEVALSLGIPHPAMVCVPQPRLPGAWNQPGGQHLALCGPLEPAEVCTFPFWEQPAEAPCSPYYQTWFLLRILDSVKQKFEMEIRQGVESAVRFNGKWKLKNRLEFWRHGDVPQVGSIVPEIFVLNGRPMVQDWETGNYIDPAEHDELSPIVTWLHVRDHPEVTSGVPGVYGAHSPLAGLDAVTGQFPPDKVIADMENASPLAPPIIFPQGASFVPFSVQSAPINFVTVPPIELPPAPGTPDELKQAEIITVPFAPGVLTGPPPVSGAPDGSPANLVTPSGPTQTPQTPQPALAAVSGGGSILLVGLAAAGILFVTRGKT